jgi:hypothetical protein
VNLRELQDRLIAIAPDARIPSDGPVDDLYPFRFAGTAFVPVFMDALMRVTLGADRDGMARKRLVALADLLECVFIEGDDDLGDALAMRLIHTRLCGRPGMLLNAWPYLGERTRRIAWKFVRLAEECDRREAAVRTRVAERTRPPVLAPNS